MSANIYDAPDEAAAQEQLHQKATEIADEYLDRVAAPLDLTQDQRDGIRVCLQAAWARGAQWQHQQTGELLGRAIGDLADNLGRLS